jgi:hypothetical protein
MITILFFLVTLVVSVRLFAKTRSRRTLVGLGVAIVGAVALMWVGWQLPMSSATTRVATHVLAPYAGGGYRELVTKYEPTYNGPAPRRYIRLKYTERDGTTHPHDLRVSATTREDTGRGEKPFVEDIHYSSSNWLLDPIPVSKDSWILHIPRDDPAPMYR